MRYFCNGKWIDEEGHPSRDAGHLIAIPIGALPTAPTTLPMTMMKAMKVMKKRRGLMVMKVMKKRQGMKAMKVMKKKAAMKA